MGDDIKLRVSKIEKSFPGVKALDKIDFTVRKGTVHALCGENGAGKTTLMNILYGLYRQEEGEILIRGQTHQLAVVGHYKRTIGRLEITYGSVALRVD